MSQVYGPPPSAATTLFSGPQLPYAGWKWFSVAASLLFPSSLGKCTFLYCWTIMLVGSQTEKWQTHVANTLIFQKKSSISSSCDSYLFQNEGHSPWCRGINLIKSFSLIISPYRLGSGSPWNPGNSFLSGCFLLHPSLHLRHSFLVHPVSLSETLGLSHPDAHWCLCPVNSKSSTFLNLWLQPHALPLCRGSDPAFDSRRFLLYACSSLLTPCLPTSNPVSLHSKFRPEFEPHLC